MSLLGVSIEMKIKGGLFALFLLSPFVQTTNGIAQSITPEIIRSAGNIQSRENAREKAKLETFESSKKQNPYGKPISNDAQLSEAQGCTKIDRLIVSGITIYKKPKIGKYTKNLTGSCVSNEKINLAIRNISNLYIKDGYVTSRAYIDNALMKQNILNIVVVEGKIGILKAENGDGYAQSTLNAAFASKQGKVLNLRDLEQGIDQLNRLGYASPSIDIKAGSQSGYSDIIIKQQKTDRKFRPSIGVNNGGSKSTGELEGSISVEVANPLGIADMWYFSYSKNLKNKKNTDHESYVGYASVPYGKWTFSASAGKNNYNALINGSGFSFPNSGDSNNTTIEAERLLYRNANTKISASGSLAVIDTSAKIRDIELLTGSYRIATAGAKLKVLKRMNNSLISMDIGYQHGIDAFGAYGIYGGHGTPTIYADIISANMFYQHKLDILNHPVIYSGTYRAQYSFDALFPAQKFNLGGEYTVRGFTNDGISGRRGVFTRQQLDMPLKSFKTDNQWLNYDISAFVGYDLGGVLKEKSDYYERGTLQSASVGTIVKSDKVRLDLYVSYPIDAPSFVKKDNHQFFGALQVGF